jgi:hypothetical protein
MSSGHTILTLDALQGCLGPEAGLRIWRIQPTCKIHTYVNIAVITERAPI